MVIKKIFFKDEKVSVELHSVSLRLILSSFLNNSLTLKKHFKLIF